MNIKTTSASLVLITGFGVAANATAAPYQFELGANVGQIEISGFGDTLDGDTIDVGFTYYLRSVDTTSGPLQERAFLDKAASVSFSFGEVDFDTGEDSDVRTLAGRFVTTTNFIFDVEIDEVEDVDTRSIGFGKYLDDTTTAILTLEDADGDLTTLSGNWRRLNSNDSNGTATALEFEFGFIDADSENGFTFGALSTFYPNPQTSIGAGLSYTDIDDFDTLSLTLGARYFVADNLFAELIFDRTDFDGFLDSDIIALGVGARF